MADPIADEVAALVDRLQPPEPTPEPAGDPAALDVARALCEATGRDPGRPIDLDEATARDVRRHLDLGDSDITNLDAAYYRTLEARAERRWHELDQRAQVEGWRGADFATLHQLATSDGEWQAWTAGRAMYDAGYRPGDPAFGPAPQVHLTGRRYSADALMDAALRTAADAARRQTREVEITASGLSVH